MAVEARNRDKDSRYEKFSYSSELYREQLAKQLLCEPSDVEDYGNRFEYGGHSYSKFSGRCITGDAVNGRPDGVQVGGMLNGYVVAAFGDGAPAAVYASVIADGSDGVRERLYPLTTAADEQAFVAMASECDIIKSGDRISLGRTIIHMDEGKVESGLLYDMEVSMRLSRNFLSFVDSMETPEDVVKTERFMPEGAEVSVSMEAFPSDVPLSPYRGRRENALLEIVSDPSVLDDPKKFRDTKDILLTDRLESVLKECDRIWNENYDYKQSYGHTLIIREEALRHQKELAEQIIASDGGFNIRSKAVADMAWQYVPEAMADREGADVADVLKKAAARFMKKEDEAVSGIEDALRERKEAGLFGFAKKAEATRKISERTEDLSKTDRGQALVYENAENALGTQRARQLFSEASASLGERPSLAKSVEDGVPRRASLGKSGAAKIVKNVAAPQRGGRAAGGPQF